MHTITSTRKVIVEGDRSKDKRVLSCNTYSYHRELFLLYINDIDTYICSSIHLFADDCILDRFIETLEDHQHLAIL